MMKVSNREHWSVVTLFTVATLTCVAIGTGDHAKVDGRMDEPHPLDPLTPAEITSASGTIRGFRPGNFVFHYLTLKEPEKSDLLPYFLRDEIPPPGVIPRMAFAIIREIESGLVFEVVVNLSLGRVESWNPAPDGAQPLPYTYEEQYEGERIVRGNASVIERCIQLGWTNMSLVIADPWAIGYFDDHMGDYPVPGDKPRRLLQYFMYGKMFEDDNEYAHPFDFLVIYDTNSKEVVDIEELPTRGGGGGGIATVPRKEDATYKKGSRNAPNFYRDVSPINISQPAGRSFQVNGYEVKWQKFKLRVGLEPREGLVIHHVNYNDSGVMRPLFYRMSLAEMFNPYGDPLPPFHRKHAFDVGQFGAGYCISSLQPQIDCLGEVHMMHLDHQNEAGESDTIPNAVCIHEEDTGILWRHMDARTGHTTTVRALRLAITSTITIANYDYIYSWHFYQDATIEFTATLTGILSTSLLAKNANPEGHGTIVSPEVNAQYHQHLFTLRIDPEVDGSLNTVSTLDAIPLPDGAANPYGQGFTSEETLFKTAGQARSQISTAKSRTWLIKNQAKPHPYTKDAVGWKLIPYPSSPMHLRKDSPIHPLAGYHDYGVWVTPYNEGQLSPAGFYINGSTIADWVEKNEQANIENEDVVIWYNFGISHLPRVEDFPIMPREIVGMMLKPFNFFLENPAIDVPPQVGHMRPPRRPSSSSSNPKTV